MPQEPFTSGQEYILASHRNHKGIVILSINGICQDSQATKLFNEGYKEIAPFVDVPIVLFRVLPNNEYQPLKQQLMFTRNEEANSNARVQRFYASNHSKLHLQR